MQDDSWKAPPFSKNALSVFSYLLRRGGSVRIGPLFWGARLSADELVAACNELVERCWVTIEWRKPRARMPEGLPERFRCAERVTATRFGRFRYPVTWSTQ